MSRSRSFPALGSRCLAATCAAAAVVTAPPAVAATPAELHTALDYQADAACPGRERFLALVDGAIDAQEPSHTAPARDLRIRVQIRATAGGYRGSMEKVDRFGASDPRVIVSPICAEVAQALALTAAFSVAPEAAAPPPALVVRRDPTPPSPQPAVHAGAAGSWLVALGASAGGSLSTDILTGIEGSGGRSFPVGGRAFPFTTSVRLRTTYARNDWADRSPIARFALWTAALEACALPRPFGFGVEVGLCASGESGWLRGQGVRIANPRVTDSLWFAFGGGPLVRVPFGPRWHLEARGAAVRPLRRAHFSFDSPAEPVADTPAVTWSVALAVGARFP
jgi:hypothetical protein